MENNQNPRTQPEQTTETTISDNGKRVIEPSQSFVQEMQTQSATTSGSPQSVPPTAPQSVYPQPKTPDNNQIQADNLGGQTTIKKGPHLKRLVITITISLTVLAGVFIALILTNTITLGKFKTIDYTSSQGTRYSLLFYAKHKHATKTLNSGETYIQLISKVSESGKFPLTLSIATGPASNMDKNGIKDCSGPLPKAFDTYNNNLNQTISVCAFRLQNGSAGVYVAGFAYNNKANIITISQDTSGVNLSSKSAAQRSVDEFGMEPYQNDIKKILSSIKVE
jgi:hypothetical protein